MYFFYPAFKPSTFKFVQMTCFELVGSDKSFSAEWKYLWSKALVFLGSQMPRKRLKIVCVWMYVRAPYVHI